MKKNLMNVSLLLGLAFVLGSCQKNVDLYDPESNSATASDFNFTTSQNVSLNVTYNTKVAVPFSVYAENPVVTTTLDDGAITSSMKDGVNALYSGFTNNDGTFSNSIVLPKYAKKLYIVSPAFFVQNVIEATNDNGTATATESVKTSSSLVSRATTSGEPTTILQLAKGQSGMSNWTTPLGTFDSYTGKVNYSLTKTTENSGLFFDDDIVKGFYTDVAQALNVAKDCPTKYLASQDLTVDENKEISITMLGGNTCWNSSLGYYYYSDNVPTDASKLHVITLFPNTQDGKWTRGNANPAGVDRGSVVQLKYYGKNYDEKAQNVFPAGTKIGFVLSSNSWVNNSYAQNKSNNFFSYTTPGLSSNNSYYKKNKTNEKAYYNVNTAFINSKGGTLVCFEDHSDDHNCSDVIFALKPKFPNVVELGNDTIKSVTNTYAFEDLWPSTGDYDMNDVVVYSDYAKVMQGNTTNSYYITSEMFSFTTDQNHSNRTELNNGLSVWINGSYANNAVVEYKPASGTTYSKYTDYTTVEENGKTYFYLTKNVKTNMGATYRITISHDYKSQISQQTSVGCFLWRDDATNGRWEVHIPYEAPTSKLSAYYQGKLISAKPYAAMSNDNSVFYPFAICLTGANANNILKLLDATNETTRIDKLYSGYASWFKSGGTTNTDWYIGE